MKQYRIETKLLRQIAEQPVNRVLFLEHVPVIEPDRARVGLLERRN